MVDSGSDVVTVRDGILQKLDLELLGTVQSRGIHATKEKQLYKAILKIGQVAVEVEVRVRNHQRAFWGLKRTKGGAASYLQSRQ